MTTVAIIPVPTLSFRFSGVAALSGIRDETGGRAGNFTLGLTAAEEIDNQRRRFGQ